MITRYCWNVVVRFRLRFDQRLALPRIADAQVLAPVKSWLFTLSKQSVTRLTIVVFCSPMVNVMRSGRSFQVCASWPPEISVGDVVPFWAMSYSHQAPH